MARAQTPTLLSLDRWAQLIGINPVHFNGARGSRYFPDLGDCQDIWPQFSWQGPTVISREDLASSIADAEQEIQHILGFALAPSFVEAEKIDWPHFYDPSVFVPSLSANLRHKAVNTRYSKVLALGKRGISIIQYNAPLLFEDLDGDSFDEIAKITVTTSITDPKEIKVYHATKGGDVAWEIRPLSSIVIGSGQAVIRFPSWLAFDPALTDAAPTNDGFQPLDVENPDSYVLSMDVFREYVDTATTVKFNWTGGSACDDTPISVAGTATIRDPDVGLIVPLLSECVGYGEVDNVSVWYKAGDVSERYKQGTSLDPLSEYWATCIMWLATARLKLPICACGPVLDLVADLQHNALQIDRSRNTIFSIITPEMITNPFGTRIGEIRAWDRVARVSGELMLGAGAW